MEALFTFWLISASSTGIITHLMGKNKGIKGCFWWGFILIPLGILIVAAKSPRNEF